MSQSFYISSTQYYHRQKYFIYIYYSTYLHISFHANWFINQNEETICFAELQTFHTANMLFNSSLSAYFVFVCVCVCVRALVEKPIGSLSTSNGLIFSLSLFSLCVDKCELADSNQNCYMCKYAYEITFYAFYSWCFFAAFLKYNWSLSMIELINMYTYTFEMNDFFFCVQTINSNCWFNVFLGFDWIWHHGAPKKNCWWCFWHITYVK